MLITSRYSFWRRIQFYWERPENGKVFQKTLYDQFCFNRHIFCLIYRFMKNGRKMNLNWLQPTKIFTPLTNGALKWFARFWFLMSCVLWTLPSSLGVNRRSWRKTTHRAQPQRSGGDWYAPLVCGTSWSNGSVHAGADQGYDPSSGGVSTSL